ncbi:MAG: ABC transporter substrate-binding protein [Clostridia bacterium]|jgi:osmoprotectant transport system substrate-binding protein
MKKIIITALLAIVVLTMAFGGGRTDAKDGSKGPVTVASKIDTEGALLGNMIRLVLEANGFKVNDRVQLGATNVVRQAILAGEIDIYPEYTGNAAFFHGQADSLVWMDATAGWKRAGELDAPQGLTWLPSAPANNTWAIAVRGDLAQSAGLSTMSDFGRYVAGGGSVKLAGSEEFVNSPAALPAFQAAYGFAMKPGQLLVLAGGNTAATEKAAADGTDGVNAAMAYGTDGQLAAFGLVVLADDKGVQPVYEPAPVVRTAVLQEYPEIQTLLEPVFGALDLVTLQTLNGRIAVDGQSATDVAASWLRSKGLLE